MFNDSIVEQIESGAISKEEALQFIIDIITIEACNRLIKKGLELDYQDNLGNTHMHYAISNSRLEIVELLLKSGANPDIANKEGIKPIQCVFNDCIDNLTKLIERYKAGEERPEADEVPEAAAAPSASSDATESSLLGEGEEASASF